MLILVVEDHNDTLDALVRLLQLRGHDVRSVRTETEAIDASKNDAFDLLICDIGLPDGDGWDLMKRLRQYCDTPGIALTGFGMAADVQASRESGFAAHLTKPTSFNQLLTTIDEVIAAKQQKPSRDN